ncbi:DUF7344 domain-containing protein [Natrinema amylolyticum]|uniref:DUF7344 domain-containing protein n=1 Tax=Natrinema amylolyticum TaxID=2878679 RepID=UPI001CF9FBB0|nr:hypothetical protein [Natrinema amylolyticum]
MSTDFPTEQDSSSSRSDGLSHDVIFTLLSQRHRRAVLDLLLAQDRTLTLRDLRNEIVEREHSTEITELDDEQAKQTMVSLHHVHIPKLAEADIVTYDQDRMIVEPTEKLEQMESFLSCASET